LLVGSAIADKGGVVRFATLPQPGPGFPEGLAADAKGNIYVATFDFSAGVTNAIYVFGPNGLLASTIPLPGTVLLGMGFDNAGTLWVADFANGNLLRLSPPLLLASYNICGGPPAGCGLNALTFDASGNVYVSDSFGGRIFRLVPGTGSVTTFFSSASLTPGGGFPPFGANGLAFDATFSNLYIANTATDSVLQLEIDGGGNPTALNSFATGINGADGLVFDPLGRLWVAANQADELVALDSNGQVVDRVGSFDGILPGGAVKGLLFPASVVVSRGSLFVTNLALPLTTSVGDEPEERVTTYTVSRIPLQGHPR
jgi:sugar lactone lactonase YvrE